MCAAHPSPQWRAAAPPAPAAALCCAAPRPAGPPPPASCTWWPPAAAARPATPAAGGRLAGGRERSLGAARCAGSMTPMTRVREASAMRCMREHGGQPVGCRHTQHPTAASDTTPTPGTHAGEGFVQPPRRNLQLLLHPCRRQTANQSPPGALQLPVPAGVTEGVAWAEACQAAAQPMRRRHSWVCGKLARLAGAPLSGAGVGEPEL